MAIDTTAIIDRVKLSVGRTESPQALVPVGAKSLRLQLNAVNWSDPDLLMTLNLERSYDNGATWEYWAGAGIMGGALDKMGNLPSFTVDMTDDSDVSTVKAPFPARAVVIANKGATVGINMIVET